MGSWAERYQSLLYLMAMFVGVGLSLLCPPEVIQVSDTLIPAALGILLFANMMGVPLTRDAQADRYAPSREFTFWLVALNAVVVPLVVMVLLPTVLAGSSAIALAAALIVLAPCIDYVVVFTADAGGNAAWLLRKTPLLLGLQILIIPLWTSIYAYIGILEYKDLGGIFPLPASAYATLLVILIPALLAYLIQRAQHGSSPQLRKPARAIAAASERWMIPIMCVLLTLMCTAYSRRVLQEPAYLPRWILFYSSFALCTGMLSAWILRTLTPRLRIARTTLGAAEHKALIFSSVTRNALVMFPIIMALSERLQTQGVPYADLMQPAVLTQTMVELIVMVALVRILKPVQDRMN